MLGKTTLYTTKLKGSREENISLYTKYLDYISKGVDSLGVIPERVGVEYVLYVAQLSSIKRDFLDYVLDSKYNIRPRFDSYSGVVVSESQTYSHIFRHFLESMGLCLKDRLSPFSVDVSTIMLDEEGILEGLVKKEVECSSLKDISGDGTTFVSCTGNVESGSYRLIYISRRFGEVVVDSFTDISLALRSEPVKEYIKEQSTWEDC